MDRNSEVRNRRIVLPLNSRLHLSSLHQSELNERAECSALCRLCNLIC